MKTPIRTEILRHLAKGHSLTPLTALKQFGCLSLSQRIGELKRQGWPVESKMVKVGKSHVSRYWLEGAR